MSLRKQPVIVSAVRTPVGKFLGALKSFKATDLGALVVREAVKRAGVKPEDVDEVIMGCVIQAGLGQNPARQAALRGGLPNTVSAVTINKVCGSGLKAVMMAAQGIQLGDTEVVVAGGMESMSNAPYLLLNAREGYRLGHGTMVDTAINDGLWCAFDDQHMGCTGEVVSERFHVSREEQDEYALNSHRKAMAAIKAGKFKDEILSVEIPQKKGAAVVFDTDEPVRGDTSIESLAKLKPAFKTEGTVTAGNAPGMNDGASALVVTSSERAESLGIEPLGRIVGQATSGIEPKLVMMAPVEAIKKLVKKIGWSLDEVDLIELNEAFAVQAVAITRELNLDSERVNVNGGAVALGHAIGQSGSRILTTMLYELKRRNAHRGIAALCLGGGNAVAMAFVGVMFSDIYGRAQRMGGEPPPPFLGLVLVLAVVFQVVFSIPPLVAGYALLKRRSWAKIAAIVGAVVAAMSFPIGTALAVYTFWFLFSDPGQQLYPSKSPEAPPPPPDNWQAAGSDQNRGSSTPPE